MHTCNSFFECVHCHCRVCANATCGRALTADESEHMAFKTLGWSCPKCRHLDDVPRKLADKLLELREAWLDLVRAPDGERWSDNAARTDRSGRGTDTEARAVRDAGEGASLMLTARTFTVAQLREHLSTLAPEALVLVTWEGTNHEIDASTIYVSADGFVVIDADGCFDKEEIIAKGLKPL